MNDKLLYRIPEVAEHLSISRSKVCELLKSGELPQFTSTEAAWSRP
jgi:excisionase family DNA binding protein